MKYGFTLLELLVVVLIVGILAGIGVPQYRRVVQKAQYDKGRALVEQIYRAEVAYYTENGQFTHDLEDLNIAFAELKPGFLGPDGVFVPYSNRPDIAADYRSAPNFGDSLLILSSPYLLISYESEKHPADYRILFVPSGGEDGNGLVGRECSFPPEEVDAKAAAEGASFCKRMGAHEAGGIWVF